jgi:hypothetical protein
MFANVREVSALKKILVLGLSILLVAGLAAATVAVAKSSDSAPLPASGSGAGAATSPRASDAGGQADGAAELLPGAQHWDKGTSSYIFGTNDGIDYASPNVETLPSVQAALKAGGLTLMRTWAYADYTDADIEQRVATIRNSGMECMMMLGTTSNLSWMEHVVSMLGPSCNIYEFGNEPDNPNNDTNIAQLTQRWIADIPQLRAINPHAVFGGPAPAWAESPAGAGSYPSDMAYFLATTAAAGVRADFISYHDYPCVKATTEAQCVQMTPGDIKANYNLVLGWETQYYGHTVPTGITEYNFDPGYKNLFDWAGNASFMSQWTTTALDAMVQAGVSFANLFTSLNYSGDGYLDMFHDSAPYAPKAQYYAVVGAIQHHGGPSNVAIPNPLPS